MKVQFISGYQFCDNRGKLYYNNNFDASFVKRIYVIENIDINFVRGWQGHQIEQRWFSAVAGSFEIKLIEIDNWLQPSKILPFQSCRLTSQTLDVLHIPKGFVTSIRSLEPNSKLMIMSDYLFGETKDEYRFPSNYFMSKNSINEVL